MSEETYSRKFMQSVVDALRDGRDIEIRRKIDEAGREFVNVTISGKQKHASGLGRPRSLKAEGGSQFGPGSLHRRRHAMVKAIQSAETMLKTLIAKA